METDLFEREYKQKIRLKKKEQWICDSCEDVIEHFKDGVLEWDVNAIGDKYEQGNFRIVHGKCERDKHYERTVNGVNINFMHLENYISDNGIVWLMSFIESKELKDVNEVLEIIRRIHVEYYEEARQYHQNATDDGLLDGANEITQYSVDFSKLLIRKYG